MSEQTTWGEIFQQLDAAGFPEDFLSDRGDEPPQNRESLEGGIDDE